MWDHMQADLEIENYIVIYTSKIIKKKDFEDKERRELLD